MRVFVCYRREDSAPWAGRLHDVLAERFGAANIFQDVEAVRAGESFVEAMDVAVAKADAMLVVIGPRWVGPDGGASRLDAADDYVRRELEVGLAYGKRLVPVLVGGARMPAASDVPDDLRPVVTRQAVVLRDESWHTDVAHLTRALDDRPIASLRRNRGVVAAGAALLLIAAAGLIYVLTRGGGESDASASSGGPADDTLDECPSPRGAGWDDLAVRSPAGQGQGQYFDYALTGGSARDDDGATVVVFAVDATVRGPGSARIYPGGWTVVPAGDFRQTCYSRISGNEQSDPGDTVGSLVGFRGTGPVDEISSLGIQQVTGETVRLDLERTG
jgi:hypothetical protein